MQEFQNFDADTARKFTVAAHPQAFEAYAVQVLKTCFDASKAGKKHVALRGESFVNFKDDIVRLLTTRGFNVAVGKSSGVVTWPAAPPPE